MSVWPNVSVAPAVALPVKFGSFWANIKKPVNVTVLATGATPFANVVLTNKGLTTDLSRADGAGDVYFFDFDDGVYYAHEYETANTWRVTITGAVALVESLLGMGVPAPGAGAVAGTITIDGAPLAGAPVVLIAQDGAVTGRVTVTDGAGAYAFTGVLSGSYAVLPIDPAGSRRSKVIHTVVAP